MDNKIRVLIVDDSAVVRQTLEKILSMDPGIEVMATASDPYIAVEKMRRELPDVITLDVQMPRMDGITFLKKLMMQCPLPVIICSAFTDEGSKTAFEALEYGAVDIISKPQVGTRQFLEESRVRICDAIKAAAMAKIKRSGAFSRPVVPKLSADVILEKPNSRSHGEDDRQGRGGRRVHRRHRGSGRISPGHAGRCARHRHCSAYAGALYRGFRGAP